MTFKKALKKSLKSSKKIRRAGWPSGMVIEVLDERLYVWYPQSSGKLELVVYVPTTTQMFADDWEVVE